MLEWEKQGGKNGGFPLLPACFSPFLLPAAGHHPAVLFLRVEALISLWAPGGVRCFHRKLQRVLLGLSVKACWIGVWGPTQPRSDPTLTPTLEQ